MCILYWIDYFPLFSLCPTFRSQQLMCTFLLFVFKVWKVKSVDKQDEWRCSWRVKIIWIIQYGFHSAHWYTGSLDDWESPLYTYIMACIIPTVALFCTNIMGGYNHSEELWTDVKGEMWGRNLFETSWFQRLSFAQLQWRNIWGPWVVTHHVTAILPAKDAGCHSELDCVMKEDAYSKQLESYNCWSSYTVFEVYGYCHGLKDVKFE